MRSFFTLTLLFVLSSAVGQPFLLLKKQNRKREIKYYVNDEIRFQLKGEKHFTSGRIDSLGTDVFVVNDKKVKLEEVYRYDIRNKRIWNFNYEASAIALYAAAAALPLAEVANTYDGNFGEARIPRPMWIASAIMVGGGVLMTFVPRKYFKPGGLKKAESLEEED